MKSAKVADVVNDCSSVLYFLSYCFSLLPPHEQAPGMTYPEQAGLSLILEQLGDRLGSAGVALAECRKDMEV